MNELARLEAKDRKRDKIALELKKMKVGFCGVMYDHLVWRINKTQWQVGIQSVSLRNEAMTVGAAAIFISD